MELAALKISVADGIRYGMSYPDIATLLGLLYGAAHAGMKRAPH